MYNLEEFSHLGALSDVERETGMTDDLVNESEDSFTGFWEDIHSHRVENIPVTYFINAIASKKEIKLNSCKNP